MQREAREEAGSPPPADGHVRVPPFFLGLRCPDVFLPVSRSRGRSGRPSDIIVIVPPPSPGFSAPPPRPPRLPVEVAVASSSSRETVEAMLGDVALGDRVLPRVPSSSHSFQKRTAVP